jgi:hypothetical protein
MGYIEKFARFWRETDRTTGQTWLHEYTGPADFEDDAYARFQKVSLAEVTADELAGLMDAELVNANYHPFAGIHGYLGGLLKDEVGATAALRILARIYVDHGWLAEVS